MRVSCVAIGSTPIPHDLDQASASHFAAYGGGDNWQTCGGESAPQKSPASGGPNAGQGRALWNVHARKRDVANQSPQKHTRRRKRGQKTPRAKLMGPSAGQGTAPPVCNKTRGLSEVAMTAHPTATGRPVEVGRPTKKPRAGYARGARTARGRGAITRGNPRPMRVTTTRPLTELWRPGALFMRKRPRA